MSTLTSFQVNDMKNACDWLGIELRSDYSGRAMYGKTCIGVVGHVGCAQDLVDKLYEYAEEDDDDAMNDLADLLEEGWSRDDMGRNVIYYWPSLRCDTEDSTVE